MFVQRYFEAQEIIAEMTEISQNDAITPLAFAWKKAKDGSVFGSFLYSHEQMWEYEMDGFQVVYYDDLTDEYLTTIVFA